MPAPRISQRTPGYLHHKPSGQALVSLNGKSIYLGPHGTPASRAKYDQVIAEWFARGRRQRDSDVAPILINKLIVAFNRHAKVYYRRPDGKPTSEQATFKSPLRLLKQLYGRLPAGEFSPLKLKAVRAQMVEAGWSRVSINKQTARIRHVFKWGVQEEMIKPAVLEGLRAVLPFTAGRCEAPEPMPVEPVAIEHIEAVLPWVSPQVATIARLQLLTGARGGEITGMIAGEIDTTGNLWVYRPRQHKTAHHGHKREIYFGPQAQAILKPFLQFRQGDPAAAIFRPIDAEAGRRRRQHARRKTPANQGNRPGTNRKRKPKWRPGNSYSTDTYRRAITRGCDAADAWAKGGRIIGNDERIVPRWHPHQLRHTAATELRKKFGIEAAQVMLGHRSLSVTEIYAQKNIDAAMRIAAEVG